MGNIQSEITELLITRKKGEDVMERLMPYVYDELRRLAHAARFRERSDHTLDTSAIVHEAYFKLVDHERTSWESKAHFFGAAARAMRQVLVDYARTRGRLKRGGGVMPLPLDEAPPVSIGMPDHELMDLDRALSRLESLDPRQCRVVECRYFSGMTVDETATALEVSPATVKRDWATAQAWLFHQLKSGRE